MRVAIIVTEIKSDLWDKSKGWPIAPGFHGEVKVAGIGKDQLLVLCQAESEEQSEPRAIRDSRQKTTTWLVDLSNSASYENARIYVAAHAGFVSFNELRTQITNGRFHAGAEFSHQTGFVRGLFDYLLELFDKVENDTFEAVVEYIGQRQERTYAERLKTLKHRVASIFLPVSVDLYAWHEFGFDDLHLQELRESYEMDDGRLDRARSLLYVESSAGDNVEKLVVETNLKDDESWTAIKLLLPPKSVEPVPEEVEEDEANGYKEFFSAKYVLDNLKDRDGLVALRKKLRVKNTFGAWCKELDRHLAQLVDKVNR
jgi:hypothetical protein